MESLKRIILFRGKIKEYDTKTTPPNNKWVEGFYYNEYIEGKIRHFIKDSEVTFEVFKDSVQEFTGCYDINKNMIFEGDIVNCNTSTTGYEDIKNAEIIFDSGCFCVASEDYWPTLEEVYNIEIIKNSYEYRN